VSVCVSGVCVCVDLAQEVSNFSEK